MNDIRRTILWVIFGFSIILLWDQWQIYNGKAATFFPTPPKAASATAAPSAPGASAAVPSAVPTASAAGTAQAKGAATLPSHTNAPAASKQVVVVQTDVLKLSIDSEGASIERAELLKHKEEGAGIKSPSKRNITVLDNSNERVYLAQTGLIGAAAYPNHKTPMTWVAGPTALKEGDKELVVRFQSAEVGGVQLVKTYTLRQGAYDILVQHEVRNVSAEPQSPQLYLQLLRDGNKPAGESMFYSTFTGPALYSAERKFEKVEFSDIEKGKAEHAKKAAEGYVAVVQHYFASAWLLANPVPREYFTRKVDTNLYAVGMIAQLGDIAPGQSKAQEARLYVGPQEEKALEALYPGLELVKDYGWLTILAKPLYWLMDKLYNMLGNWGWAIVGLVVLLKAAFYWLNASAYRSMAKMKAVNPRVMELKERLKDKPQEMQQAMMKLYRDEKVNPLGGCFPILIQIPVFIALYWVLLATVEMRNAPWIGWITDLSSPDPYFILPLVMTGTTVLQTWLNPTPPDPVQAKLMWIMPLVFSVMFFFFPSGLVLYWLTNNVLSIAQQYFINKKLGVLGK
jgi:YidC/Oxa1 family membrane protein insertase